MFKKKIIIIVIILLICLGLVFGINYLSSLRENKKSNDKTLIIYFSNTGHTKEVAELINDNLNADIIELEPLNAYPENYDELEPIAQEEKNNNARPELKTKIENIEKYDTIFLGYPIWFSDMPMIMYTFLDNYDLSNKEVNLFVTSASSGLSNTKEKIQEIEKDAKVNSTLSITNYNAEYRKNLVNTWIKSLKY